MKQAVKKFRSLAICLKELEPFITDGQHLLTGKPFEKMHGMRSREILGNWLCCVAINSITQPDRLAFTSDPSGGDGVIIDTATDEIWLVEHIMIPAVKPGDDLSIENLIAAAIQKKQEKGGSAYASGKTLIIFLTLDWESGFPIVSHERFPLLYCLKPYGCGASRNSPMMDISITFVGWT